MNLCLFSQPWADEVQRSPGHIPGSINLQQTLKRHEPVIEKLAGSAVNTDLKCEFGTGVEPGTYSYGEVRVCFTTRNVEMVEYGRVVLPAEVFFFLWI